MDKGKALVRSYEVDANTQKIFAELCEDTLRSTNFSIDSSRLLSYITSVRIGDGHWNGTTHHFILHWQEQVQLLTQQPTSALDKRFTCFRVQSTPCRN